MRLCRHLHDGDALAQLARLAVGAHNLQLRMLRMHYRVAPAHLRFIQATISGTGPGPDAVELHLAPHSRGALGIDLDCKRCQIGGPACIEFCAQQCPHFGLNAQAGLGR